MKTRKLSKEERVLVLKVTMIEEVDQPSRIIAFPESDTLYKLAEAITASFGFDFEHAFGFYDNVDFWGDSIEGYELFRDMGEDSRFPGVENTKAGKVFSTPEKEIFFLFDYGDQWGFLVEFQMATEAKDDEAYPLLLESKGAAPLQYGDGEIDDDDDFYDEDNADEEEE